MRRNTRAANLHYLLNYLSILDILDPANKIPNTPRGIDLAKRGHEVTKLLYAGFARKIIAQGYEIEDVLQEVYAGILARNKGKGAFNPNASSFGSYVYMVIRCILSNYHRKQTKLTRGEYHPPNNPDNDISIEENTPAPDTYCQPMDMTLFQDLYTHIQSLTESGDPEARLALQALPYVSQGYGRSEIAQKLNIPKATASKTLAYLRQTTREWLDN